MTNSIDTDQILLIIFVDVNDDVCKNSFTHLLRGVEMPNVISVLNTKGGSGKTTIATNLAHAMHLDGRKVLLVDNDPQGSLRDWNELNEGSLIPVVGLDRVTIHQDLKAIGSAYEIIIIDGAPQADRLAGACVRASDIVLIPVQPSPYDIWACEQLVQLVKSRQEVTDGLPKAFFVVSRAIKNTKLSGDILGALADFHLPIFESATTQRVSYPTTAAEGSTVMEHPESAAAKEISAIKDELLGVINATRA